MFTFPQKPEHLKPALKILGTVMVIASLGGLYWGASTLVRGDLITGVIITMISAGVFTVGIMLVIGAEKSHNQAVGLFFVGFAVYLVGLNLLFGWINLPAGNTTVTIIGLVLIVLSILKHPNIA